MPGGLGLEDRTLLRERDAECRTGGLWPRAPDDVREPLPALHPRLFRLLDRPQHGELEEDGRFAPCPYLDGYWTEADRTPLLIRADGHVAGFALINTFAHSGLPIDFSVAEFFVVRKHRRAGVGFTAATRIIRARPGQWEMAVARRNTAALPFWRRVASAIAGPAVEELDRDDDALWDGPILRFRVG
jgi:predicted acetyltransferase